MVPLSFSFLMNEMAIGKPKSPHMPKNLKPVSILMSVSTGCSPICFPISLGSTIFLMMVMMVCINNVGITDIILASEDKILLEKWLTA